MIQIIILLIVYLTDHFLEFNKIMICLLLKKDVHNFVLVKFGIILTVLEMYALFLV